MVATVFPGGGVLTLNKKNFRPKKRCSTLNKTSSQRIGSHAKKRLQKNVKNSPVNANTFNPTFNPSITIYVSAEESPASPFRLETLQYMAYAKKGKTVYTDQDALKHYGSSDILDPGDVAITHLFINGVLQPPSIYEVEEGALYLKASDLPPVGAPIILLFVIIRK